MPTERPAAQSPTVRKRRQTPRSRRPAGQPAIRRRGPQSFATEVMVGWREVLDPTSGEATRVRDRRWLSGPTRESVLDQLAQLRLLQRRGGLPAADAGRLPLAAYLAAWLESKRGTIEQSSWQRYEECIRLHLVPALGTVSLAALRPDDLRTLYRRLREEVGRAPGTVRYVHVTVRAALAQAVRERSLSHNVADLVRPPKVTRTEIHPLTPTQIVTLLAAADPPWHVLLTLAIYTGARLGELLGLRWTDWDERAATLTIHGRLAGTKDGRPVLHAHTKTMHGLRTLPLSPTVHAALAAQRAWQTAARAAAAGHWRECGLICTTDRGTPPTNVSRDFAPLKARAGLRASLRFHDLRHTCATLQLAAGTDLGTVSRLLGHAHPGITARVYAQMLRSGPIEAAVRLERYIAAGSGPSTLPNVPACPPNGRLEGAIPADSGSAHVNGCL